LLVGDGRGWVVRRRMWARSVKPGGKKQISTSDVRKQLIQMESGAQCRDRLLPDRAPRGLIVVFTTTDAQQHHFWHVWGA